MNSFCYQHYADTYDYPEKFNYSFLEHCNISRSDFIYLGRQTNLASSDEGCRNVTHITWSLYIGHDSLLRAVFIKHKRILNGTRIHKFDGLDLSLHEKPTYWNGMCYSFNPAWITYDLVSLGIRRISFVARRGIKVFVHRPRHYYHIENSGNAVGKFKLWTSDLLPANFLKSPKLIIFPLINKCLHILWKIFQFNFH